MGEAVSKDAVLFRQFTRPERKLSTTWGPWKSLAGWPMAAARLLIDTKSDDLWLVDFDRFGNRQGRTHRGQRRDQRTGTGTVIDGRYALHTTKGAPKGGSLQWMQRSRVNRTGACWFRRTDAVIEAVSFAKDACRHVLGMRRT